jgi:hypothetical protein
VSVWEWHAYDFATNAYVTSVPMGKFSCEDKIGTLGAFAAEMAPPQGSSPEALAARARNLIGAVEDTKNTIVALRTDDFGVTRAEFTAWIPPGGNRRPSLAGTGMLGYFDRRYVENTLGWSNIDQVQIVIDLLNAVPGRMPLDLATGVNLSGVTRTAGWTPSDAKKVSEAISDISQRLNGFDLDLRTEIDAGKPVRRLRTWYPRRGGESVPTFEYGANMLSEPEVAGSEKYANQIFALGKVIDSGDSTTPQVRLVSIKASGETPIVSQQLDRQDITTQQGLDDAARGALVAAGIRDDAEITFQVDPNHPLARHGTYDLGADCLVKFPDGLRPWWPDGMNQVRRVIGRNWKTAGASESLEIVTGLRWGS